MIFLTSEYTRDPDSVELTSHALNKVKERQIGAHEIKKAISEGSIDEEYPNLLLDEDPNRQYQIAYELEMPISLWVILDTRNDKIVTAFYDDQEGAVDGSITGGRYMQSVRLKDLLR